MSADNFLAVLKEGNKYIGYHCSASVFCEVPGWRKCYPCMGSKDFEASTLEEAIYCCEHFDEDGMGYLLEYGYSFVDSRPLQEPEEGFCEICAHNPKLPREGSKRARALGCNCERKRHNGFYSYKLGDDCPVHLNIRWQKKIGWKEQD